MIEVEITQKMKEQAWRKAREMGELKNSITAGDGNICGFVGEFCAQALMGGIIENTRDYDLVIDGLKYDVKTKRCTSEPQPHYDCSVAAYNTVQKCDRYVFVRIEQDKKTKRWGRAWVLGWYDKEEYYEYARFLQKGQKDGDNWFTVKADCFNIAIEDLFDVRELH